MTQELAQFLPSSKPWTPHGFQKRAVKWLVEHAAAALFLDPGMGKTSIALAAFLYLKKRGVAKKALLVAPLKPVYLTWPAEIQKWTDFNGLRYVILHGPNKEEALETDADIYLINPEGIEWLTQATKKRSGNRVSVDVDAQRFKGFGFDTLILDELSLFKNYASVRFKAVKCIHKLFARRWGLTGSPMPNGLLDLFGQCFLLDEGNALGRWITEYRNNYFVPHPNGFDWILQKGAATKIYKAIKPLALRMSADDFLELPPLVDNKIMLDLPLDVRRIYNELEKDLYAQVDDKEIVAASAGVKSGMLLQILSGAIYTKDKVPGLVKQTKAGKKEWVELHDVKIEAAKDLVRELQGQQLLLAYHFGHTLERLQAAFGKSIPFIGGGVTGKKAKAIEAAWNAGEIPLLLGHPQSMAHGLNFQGSSARHVGWLDMIHNYEWYMQFIRRILRQGTHAPRVTNHLFMVQDSLDVDVYATLGSKRHDQNALFKALTARIKYNKLQTYAAAATKKLGQKKIDDELARRFAK